MKIMANMLVLFGFSWMVVAACIGFYLARRHELTSVRLEEIAAKGNLLDYHRVNYAYKWNKTVHAHAFLFSMVAVAVGLAMGKMNYADTVTNILAVALMVSAVVWTLGGVLSNRPLMVIGDLTLLASVATTAVGLAKAL
jgi:hypothetical protein